MDNGDDCPWNFCKFFIPSQMQLFRSRSSYTKTWIWIQCPAMLFYATHVWPFYKSSNNEVRFTQNMLKRMPLPLENFNPFECHLSTALFELNMTRIAHELLNSIRFEALNLVYYLLMSLNDCKFAIQRQHTLSCYFLAFFHVPIQQ